MVEPKSSKAIYVNLHAPPFCNIWFICGGRLVCTREDRIGSSSCVITQEKTLSLACQVRALEKLYADELKKRKETELELERLKNHHRQTWAEAPSYFVCPILQDVMKDPHVAADGYTYEAEALRQWLDVGNGTSPMTNLQLSDNRLIPNRALRSAIQEWLQLQQNMEQRTRESTSIHLKASTETLSTHLKKMKSWKM